MCSSHTALRNLMSCLCVNGRITKQPNKGSPKDTAEYCESNEAYLKNAKLSRQIKEEYRTKRKGFTYYLTISLKNFLHNIKTMHNKMKSINLIQRYPETVQGKVVFFCREIWALHWVFGNKELAQKEIQVMLNDSQLNAAGARRILHPETRIKCQICQ